MRGRDENTRTAITNLQINIYSSSSLMVKTSLCNGSVASRIVMGLILYLVSAGFESFAPSV